jgi:hypothetical protein
MIPKSENKGIIGGGGALIPNTLSSVQMGNTGKLEFSNFTMGSR